MFISEADQVSKSDLCIFLNSNPQRPKQPDNLGEILKVKIKSHTCQLSPTQIYINFAEK